LPISPAATASTADFWQAGIASAMPAPVMTIGAIVPA
jgi:hypothetical protein